MEHKGPFWSLHVEVGRTTETSAQELDARWTTIRHELEHHEAPQGLIDDLGSRLHENPHAHGEARRTIVATEDGVVFDDLQIGHIHRPESTDRGDLPDFSGWLTNADRELPFVLVVADREGADIDVYRATSRPRVDHESVEGETFYITKVAEGDWAQKQFQQSAENAWRHNASLVADAVRSAGRKHRPAAVLLAGEVRARAEVLRALGDKKDSDTGSVPGSPNVVEVEGGGRAAGASDEALWSEVRGALAELQAAQDAEVAARLDEARGRGEGAAHGLDAVFDALVQQRVDRLVLDLDTIAGMTVRPSQHEGLSLPPGADQAETLPADRALVAAGALTGASLSLLPADMGRGGGVAALLRWA